MTRLPALRRILLLAASMMVAGAASCSGGATSPAPATRAASPTTSLTAAPNPPSPTAAPGHVNWIVRGNLMRSLTRFEAKGSARVAFLGGSVTTLKWRELVADYLTHRFPTTSFDFVNAGLSGTPAELGAFRLEQDVFARGPVDLLFLEFAVNGGSIEAMEGIVRHARALSPDIDIVQMQIAARWFSDSLDNGVVPSAIVDHEKVAEHYGNSSIYLYREIYDRMKDGAFDWDKFAPDGVHPTEFGSSIYAAYITRFLEAVWEQGGEVTRASMPASLVSHPWEHGTLITYERASSTSGFSTVVDWTPALNGNLKGPVSFISSSRAGSKISFHFKGTVVGLYAPVGPDSAKVEYSIDGSKWAVLDTARDSWYPNDYVRLSGFILSSSLSDSEHVITFRTISDAGKVFRLYRLMVG